MEDGNNDGLLDIMLSKVGLFKNLEKPIIRPILIKENFNFKEEATTLGIRLSLAIVRKQAFFDYDNDGIWTVLINHSIHTQEVMELHKKEMKMIAFQGTVSM